MNNFLFDVYNLTFLSIFLESFEFFNIFNLTFEIENYLSLSTLIIRKFHTSPILHAEINNDQLDIPNDNAIPNLQKGLEDFKIELQKVLQEEEVKEELERVGAHIHKELSTITSDQISSFEEVFSNYAGNNIDDGIPLDKISPIEENTLPEKISPDSIFGTVKKLAEFLKECNEKGVDKSAFEKIQMHKAITAIKEDTDTIWDSI